MLEAVIWISLGFLVLAALLIWIRIREDRFLKKSTKETVRPQIRAEMEAEKEDTLRRKKAFLDSLDKWGS